MILGFASIGVFAINNATIDIWSLFWFGVLGFFMRLYSFPLAPLILGVVPGDITELTPARAVAIDPDPALFFFTLALFSAAFPCYQSARARGARWTGFHGPALVVALTLPLSLMGSWFRTAPAALARATGLSLGRRALHRPAGA